MGEFQCTDQTLNQKLMPRLKDTKKSLVGRSGVPEGAQKMKVSPRQVAGVPEGAQSSRRCNTWDAGVPEGAQNYLEASQKGSGVPAGAQSSPQGLSKGAGVPEGAQNYLEASQRGSGVPAGAQSNPQGLSKGAGVPEGAQITVDDTLKGAWGTCGGPECFSHWLINPATQVSLLDAPKFVPMGPWPIPHTPNPCPQSMAAALSNFLPLSGSGEQVAILPLERRFVVARMVKFKFRIERREITARKAVKRAGF